MAKSPYTDIPEPLKSRLPAMFSSYPNLDSHTPSSWFVFTYDKVIAHNAGPCHADLQHDGQGWNELVTAVPNNSEVALEYLRMLIRGPFRSMSDLIKLDRIKDTYYLHCLNLAKWPANVLMNFCIASRVPIEFKYLLEGWAERCEAGFDPTLAFLLTYSYGTGNGWSKSSTSRTFQHYRGGHLWLDPASDWSNILNGVMERTSLPFKTNPGTCRPTNIIWGHSSDYMKLQDMSDKEIAAFYAQPIAVYEKPAPPKPIQMYKLKPFNVQEAQAQAVQFLQELPVAAQQAGWAQIHAEIVIPPPPQHDGLPNAPEDEVDDEFFEHFDFADEPD